MAHVRRIEVHAILGERTGHRKVRRRKRVGLTGGGEETGCGRLWKTRRGRRCTLSAGVQHSLTEHQTALEVGAGAGGELGLAGW